MAKEKIVKEIGKKFSKAENYLNKLISGESGNLDKWVESDGGVFHPGNKRISQRLPEGVNQVGDPYTHNLTIDTAAMQKVPGALGTAIRNIEEYNSLKPQTGTTLQKLIGYQSQMKDNLLSLHDAMPSEARDQAKLWYDGANKLAKQFSKQYGVSEETVAAVMAALSPQTDWFKNVSRAERVLDIVTGNTKGKIDEKVVVRAKEIFGDEKYSKDLEQMITKPYEEMTTKQKAMFIRSYDEAMNKRQYRVVSPDGHFMDYSKKKDGTPEVFNWASLGPIEKAISVIENPSMENISKQMGGEHKVRNFYNNIVDPTAAHGDVTIDTHAVAAQYLQPFSGKSEPVIHNFGGKVTGNPNSVIGSKNHGVSGTYGLNADVYRSAADEVGLLPREMQSITWEAVRGLFPKDFKTNKNQAFIEQVWRDYKSGNITLKESRELINEATKGIKAPSWYKEGFDIRKGESASQSSFKDNQSGMIDPEMLGFMAKVGLFGVAAMSANDAEAAFIGPKAVTWSKEAAAKAKELLDQGVDPEAVRKITGIVYNRPTHVGSEGNLRQEISDATSKFIGGKQPTAAEKKQLTADKKTVKKLNDLTTYMQDGFANKTLSVSDLEKIRKSDEYEKLIEEHIAAKDRINTHNFKYKPQVQQGPMDEFMQGPVLDEYPGINKYDTTFTPTAADSWYRDSTKQFGVGGAKIEGYVDDTGRALHEVQHAIQSIEGNDRGGSIGMFMPEAQKKYDAIISEIQSINDNLKRNVEYRDMLKAQGGSESEIADLKNAYDEMLTDRTVLSSKIINKDAEGLAFDQYLAMPGEREARATGERASMDIMERVKNTPSNLLGGPGESADYSYSGIMNSTPKQTDLEKAHQVAQQNAALPIEQGGLGLPSNNTAMDRANAMGFDVDNTLYHGSPDKNITEFNIDSQKNHNIVGDAEGVYFTPDVQQASMYSRQKKKNFNDKQSPRGEIYKTIINQQNPLDITDDINNRPKGMSFSDAKKLALQKVDRSIHSGVVFRGDAYNKPEHIVFDTANIRSPDAAFDPLKRNSSNILASAGAGIVASGGLMGSDDADAGTAISYSDIFKPVQDEQNTSDVRPPVQLTPEQPVMQKQPSLIDQNIAQLRDTFAQRRVAKGGTIRKQNKINAMSQEELNATFGEQQQPSISDQNVSLVQGNVTTTPMQQIRGPVNHASLFVADNIVSPINQGLKGSAFEILSPVATETVMRNRGYGQPNSNIDIATSAMELGTLGSAKALKEASTSLLTPALSALFSGEEPNQEVNEKDQEVLDAITEEQRKTSGQKGFGNMVQDFIMRR